MLQPVTLLALDDAAAPLAAAVQQRIAARVGLEDLAQWRALGGTPPAPGAGGTPAHQPPRRRRSVDAPVPPLADILQSVHARRQHPDSPLRARDDLSARELVLLLVSATGPARETLIATARELRAISRRFAPLVSIEIVCLLPAVTGATSPADYAAAYALLAALSTEEEKPFDEAWLIDAMNARRVRLGALADALDAYAEAIAGMLLHEPEKSGALPGLHPRGMPPAFSAFGYASLVFPRDTALQRVEPRFAAELIRTRLLGGTALPRPQLAAKQLVAGDAFALPLSRIGADAGQSLFRRFQPRTQVTERTRGAEEVIAAARAELQAFRDSTHLRNLETLAKQGEQSARELVALLGRTADETLDRDGYDAARGLLDALLDPLPEVRPDAELAPRNLVTEVGAATATLDARLHFAPNTAASDAARRRIRELETRIHDQSLVAATVAPVDAAEPIAELEREKEALIADVPQMLFAEERENNAARSEAREAETVRLAAETQAREQELRELFVQLPRAEQALREALEQRRAWLWRQVVTVAVGITAMYAIPFAFDDLLPLLGRITWAVLWGLVAFCAYAGYGYFTQVAPAVRGARERLARVRAQIEATDQAKNAAHDAELQFEWDVTQRRAMLRVLRAVHEAAKEALSRVGARRQELEALAASFVPASIAERGLVLPVIGDEDVDAWYERTAEDRRPFVRELPVRRSESLRVPIDELRQRIAAYAATAFGDFRKLTLGTAAATLAPAPKLAQRLRRFEDACAPLAEVRDDDLPAQQAMQRDCTLWVGRNDATWTAQLQRRFPEAQVIPAADALAVHAVTRVLHYPAYVLGQIEHYRAQHEAAGAADVPEVVPAELVVGVQVRDAYEQVLLARALGVITVRGDGQLAASDGLVLGDSHLAAARRLALPESTPSRDRLEGALSARLEVAADLPRELRSLRGTAPLTPLDRTVLDGLLRKYAI